MLLMILICCGKRRPKRPSLPNSSSAEAIARNEDLLAEILVRMPVRSLIRSKCVSKRWCSLISSSYFCQRHIRQNPGKVSGLFMSNPYFTDLPLGFVALDETQTRVPTLEFFNIPNIQILQSCNGLLLCCSVPDSSNDLTSYYVCNPTTKQFAMVPPPRERLMSCFLGVNLAFDPAKSPHYKLICVKRGGSQKTGANTVRADGYEIEIYLPEIRDWECVKGSFSAPSDVIFERGVFWNGGIHWISDERSSIYFDIERELVKTLPLPRVYRGFFGYRFNYFGESHGHLHLIEANEQIYRQLNVFELEKDYSGWTIKYQISLLTLMDAFPQMVRDGIYVGLLSPTRPITHDEICVVRGENEEDTETVLSIPGKVISYNPIYRTSKSLPELTDCIEQIPYPSAYQYIESLADVEY